ncbi:hypothetical protein GCM10027035_40240 [Emticicia sediminis]
MVEWKQEEKEQFYQGSLALIIGLFLVYLGEEATINLWLNKVPNVSYIVYLKVLVCFLGLILLIFSITVLRPIVKIKVSKQKPIVEAITWEHFKVIEPKPLIVESPIPDKTTFERPKTQTLTRANKDLVKTNQVTAVLSDDDVALIKNISNNFLTKQQ